MMGRRRWTLVGGSLAGVGGLLGLLSVALAWAHVETATRVTIAGISGSHTDRASLFDLPNGGWYFALLLLLAGAGVMAALTAPPVARIAGATGGVLALAGLAVVLAIWPDTETGDAGVDLFGLVRAQTEVSIGPGGPLALAAMMLLGAGIFMLGFRPPTATDDAKLS